MLLKRIGFALLLTGFVLASGVVPFGKVYGADEPAFLVASPKLRGPYAGSVMLVTPFEGVHIGLILNKPTTASMGRLFPDHEPSKAVSDPVYRGGFHNQAQVLMLKAGPQPTPRSIEMMPGHWLCFETHAIDEAIEKTPNEQRFYMGFVIFREGELDEEMKKGFWTRRKADPGKLRLPDTSTLYEQLAPIGGGRVQEI
jgi:putative AlgH/UPF0301 family transcriptional regulator